MLRTYYRLAKPGIVYGNDLSAIAGFLLASQGYFDFQRFLLMLIGLSLIMASACVMNNYLDRGIDKRMARTKERALVAGTVPTRAAAAYALLLLVAGSLLLGLGTTALALYCALFGLFTYVGLYGYAKRHTSWSTLIGSISGAMPPVIGYVAVTGQFDGAALLLFLILVCWQMPHFYAIALYRQKDYEAARIPLLPITHGVRRTKIELFVYLGLFIITTQLFRVNGYSGLIYEAAVSSIGVLWLGFGVVWLRMFTTEVWARKMFFMSLLALVTTCAAISVNSFI